jgi:hypothetical protein
MAIEDMLAAGAAPDPKAIEAAAAPAADPSATVDPKTAETKAADPKAAETKAADPKAAETKAADPKAADPKTPEGAPEKYADFTLPEGLTLDPKDVAGFHEVAKGLNLTQEQAQALVDFQAKHELEKVKGVETFWAKQAADWAQAAKDHPEFGGDKFNESVKLANQAIDKFGSKELREDLGKYGFQNNPHLFVFLAKVAQSTKDDKLVTGGSPGESSKRAADVLFPSMVGLK